MKIIRFLLLHCLCAALLLSCAADQTEYNSESSVDTVKEDIYTENNVDNTDVTKKNENVTLNTDVEPPLNNLEDESENISNINELFPVNFPSGEKEAVSSSAFDKLEGVWYYLTDPEWTDNGRRQYSFSFSPNEKKMTWTLGYMYSETVNSYERKFKFETDGIISANLTDEQHNAIPTAITLYVEYG